MTMIVAGVVLTLVVLAFAASVGFKVKVGPFNFDLAGRPILAIGTWGF